MNYGIILASGTGTRVKKINIPKQYYEILDKPIFIYTLERMINSNLFDFIYIAINKNYHSLVDTYLKKYFSDEVLKQIKIVFGGKERIDTIYNTMKEIKSNNIGDDDTVVIHDAVRPFVTDKILKDSIEGAKEYGAVVAALPVADTMLVSEEGEYVDIIPPRRTIYRGQSPDSFKLKTFIELTEKLTTEQKQNITGTSQICTMNDYPIKMITGDDLNFKITTDFDLRLAETIIKNNNMYDNNKIS